MCRDRTQSVGFSYRGGDRRLWGSNGRNCLVVFPSAAKCLVEGDQLNACHSLGDDVLGFEFKLLSLGIQDVEEVRQPSLIALRRKPDCIKGRAAGAGKPGRPTLFGVVTGNRLVYLLHGTQYIFLVSNQCFAGPVVSHLDTRIKSPEVQDRPVERRTNPADESDGCSDSCTRPALAAHGTCHSHTRKKICDRRPRARRRGPYLEFRQLDIRTSLQQTDRQTGRNPGRKTRSGSIRSQLVSKRLRILSEQGGDDVLGRLELARERTEAGLECGELALRQRHIEFVCESLIETGLHELKTPPGGFDVPAGYIDLRLKTPQLAVGASNVGDDGYESRVASLRGGQRIQI